MLSVSWTVQAKKGLQGVIKGTGCQGQIQLQICWLCGSDLLASPSPTLGIPSIELL